MSLLDLYKDDFNPVQPSLRARMVDLLWQRYWDAAVSWNVGEQTPSDSALVQTAWLTFRQYVVRVGGLGR